MSITLRVDELNFVPGNTARASAASTPLAHWNIEVSDGSKSARMKLRDPSSTLADQGLPGLGPEETMAWYLEDHIDKPFETTKSGTAAALLRNYGRDLASQIAAGDLVPNDGHLQLQIVTPRRTEKSPESLWPSLQQLHWEVLEDVSVWPDGSRLTKVSVVRSLGSMDTCTPSAEDTANPPTNKAFRILLVVGRPNVEHGAEY
jgi:hypothetical protein